MMSSFGSSGNRIIDVYKEAEIELDRGLSLNASQDFAHCSNNIPGSALFYSYTPTAELATVAYGAWLINTAGARPAESQIQVADDEDVAVKAFVRMSNAALENELVNDVNLEGTHGCAESESKFARLFRFMDGDHVGMSSLEENSVRGQIITDEQGPLILRKLIGAPTGLLLRDFTIDSIPCSAGSLIALGTKAERYVSPEDGSVSYNSYAIRRSGQVSLEDTIEIVPVEDVDSHSFKRLTGFAYDPEQRSQIFAACKDYSRAGGVSDYFNMPMSDILDLVTQKTPQPIYA